MRWMALLAVGLLVGCATTRDVVISTKPADALISVDGRARARPNHRKVHFQRRGRRASRHRDAPRLWPQLVEVNSTYDKPDLVIELPQRTRKITIHVGPTPAVISVDGHQQSGGDALADLTLTLPFTVDSKNKWTEHVVEAQKPGYQSVQQIIKWDDSSDEYALTLDVLRKDISIVTDPPRASISIGGRPVGVSPVIVRGVGFAPDPKTGSPLPQRVIISKAGYDSLQTSIAWDNGRSSYEISLAPKTKTVRFITDPSSATVTIDGQTLAHDASGASVGKLAFPPTDDAGMLKTYNALVTKKTPDTDWIPEEITIAWDSGKTDYPVTLAEVKTRRAAYPHKLARNDDGWQIVAEHLQTLGMKDVTEGPTSEPPVRITDMPAGAVIDSLTVSPDGKSILFTVLQANAKDELHSQIEMVRSDGSASPTLFGDGRTLDLTPSFTPDGNQIVFSSNRGGRKLSIWQMAANGEGGITQLTAGDTTDLWPVVDSDPRPRLYYQAMVDSRPDPRLYMAQLGTTLRTDLTQPGGMQPRISPTADAVLFTLVNPKTNKREIYKMSDRGGAAINLTADPDFENFDPTWSADGGKIAFVSDRDVDSDGHHNFDINILELAHPDKPKRITTNGSWDDCPAWSPDGKYLYFRSNRGGTWGIWRVTVR